jgi:hypothetical protein
LDEDTRDNRLWTAIRTYNRRSVYWIDAVRVGDPGGPPAGTRDAALLVWAETEARLIVTRDENTIPNALARHLAAGRHSPGILCARQAPFNEITDVLAAVAHASRPDEWVDAFNYFP